MSESPAQQTTPAQPGPRSLHRGILTALLLIVPPVVLVIALGIALTKLPKPTDPNSPNMPPPSDETDIAKTRAKHDDAVHKFTELETAYRKLDADFYAVLGFTLEDSGSKEKYSDQFLDVLTGPDPPIEAWTSLRNAAISKQVFDEKRQVLRSIENKIRELRVTLTDQFDAVDVGTWADQKLAALGGQTENVRSLQARLKPLTPKETP